MDHRGEPELDNHFLPCNIISRFNKAIFDMQRGKKIMLILIIIIIITITKTKCYAYKIS